MGTQKSATGSVSIGTMVYVEPEDAVMAMGVAVEKGVCFTCLASMVFSVGLRVLLEERDVAPGIIETAEKMHQAHLAAIEAKARAN